MSHITHWLVVLVYIVPLIGTLAAMRRRAQSLLSIGDSLRALFPEDRYYRKIKLWEQRYHAWRTQNPIAAYINLDFLNRVAGKIEYAFGHLRDYTIGVYMMAAFVFDITLMIFGETQTRGEQFPSLFYHGFFALLSLWTYRRHVCTGLMMTEFMRVNPHVHPQEFFEHYYRRLGPSNIPVPTKATRVVNPTHISYLTGKKPKQSYWLLLRGMYDTAIFARSAYKTLDTIGEEYGREVFDVMASLWGSRMLQLFRAKLVVEGVEKFHALSGKIVLVFNHKSHLDFVFNFFGLSSTHLAQGRSIRPRYMAAKDHFVDNRIVYSGLGVGKLIETVDMVFVDRKGKGKDAILDACQKLGEKQIEIAMYPQGTRALWNSGPQNERLDAGFYTTGTTNSLKKDLGHLKKGCAFLAIDTALSIHDQNSPLHLVFIGIDGTGTLVPKGAVKVQTETTVRFTVGDVFTLMPQDVEGLEKPADTNPLNEAQIKYTELVEKIQREINRGLVKALQLHEKLRTRFLEDVRKENLVPKENILKLNHRLIQAEKEEEQLPFMILDRIYALPYQERVPLLKEIAVCLLENKELTTLNERVIDQLFQRRGKELKTIITQERARKVS